MASSQMDIDRLSKEELLVELNLRGLNTEGTVAMLRKTLRSVVNLESTGYSFSSPQIPLTADEVKNFRGTVNQLKEAITSSDRTTLDVLKVRNGLNVLHRQLTSYSVFGSLSEQYLDEMKKDLELLETQFTTEFVPVTRELAQDVPEDRPEVTLLDLPIPTTSSQPATVIPGSDAVESNFHCSSPHDRRSVGFRVEQPQEAATLPTLNRDNGRTSELMSGLSSFHVPNFRNKPVPVYQWRLNFDGETNSQSISAFLEKVQEHRIARHLTEDELFDSAVDLFTGKALIWYRANRCRVRNWKELDQALREEFLPPDYHYRLLEEIKNRTQGEDEGIGVYVAVMQNLFSRLSIPPTEDYMLSTIRRNLHPFYTSHFGFTRITTLRQLISFGRQLEENRSLIKNYKPPPVSRATLEPDLAYQQPSSVPSRALRQSISAVQPSVCWNCRNSGHRFSTCSQPRQRFCHRCGHPDVIVSTCPSCSRNNTTPRPSNSNSENLNRNS